MHVIVEPNPALKMSALTRSNARAGNSTGFQKRDVTNVTPIQPAARDKSILTWLTLGAFSGIIAAMAAIFTTVIDWKALGWRNFWLAVCIAGFAGLITFIWRMCALF
jgi:hypothetical protein